MNDELLSLHAERDIKWSESLAIGNEAFVDEVNTLPGHRAKKRKKVVIDEKYMLRETSEHYRVDFDSEMSGLGLNNQLFLDETFL